MFTAILGIFHQYRADHSSKVSENRRTHRKSPDIWEVYNNTNGQSESTPLIITDLHKCACVFVSLYFCIVIFSPFQKFSPIIYRLTILTQETHCKADYSLITNNPGDTQTCDSERDSVQQVTLFTSE